MNNSTILSSQLQGLLHPPSPPIGLLQVLDNLNRIVKNTKFPLPERVTTHTKNLENIIQEISIVCHDKQHLQSSYDVPVNKRLSGTITYHPLWALLYVDNRNSPFIISLQSAALEAVHGVNNRKIRAHDLQPFGRLIRNITSSQTSDKILQYSPGSYEKLKFAVQRLLNHHLHNISSETIEDSSRLLKVINNEKVKRLSKIGKKNQTRKPITDKKEIPEGEITTFREGDPDDINAPEDLKLHTPTKIIPLTRDELLELDELGVEEMELEHDFLSIILENGICSKRISSILEKYKVSAVRNMLSRENAALSNSYNLLTDHEIIQFYQLIKNLRDSELITNKKLSLALWTMLITSSKLERLSSFAVLKSRSDFDRKQYNLAYIANESAWLIPTILPIYKTEEKENSAKERNTKYEYLILPDQFNLSRQFEEADIKTDDFAFENIDLKTLLKGLLKDLGERVTLSKIARYHVDTAKSQYDPTLVQFIFGRNISTASARQYYSTFKISEILNSYFSLNNNLSYIIDVSPTVIKAKNTNLYVGARYVANTHDIRTSLRKIDDELSKNSEQELVLLHNWTTVKCIFIQSIFTAIRAVRDPFISLNQLELSDHVVSFQDKSGEDFNHVRFQPQHPIVKNIADFYDQFRKTIIKQLPNKQKIKIREFEDHTFILTDDLKVVPASPKTLNPFWEKISDYPINSNRKFIRNKLRYLDVPQHAIDTILGHHSEGEALWSSYNTSSISDIAPRIDSAFNKIIDELNLNFEWNYAE